MWKTEKAVLRGKSIASNVYTRKEKKYIKINNLNSIEETTNLVNKFVKPLKLTKK